MSEKVKIKIARNVVHLPAIALRGLVVRDMCTHPSNWRSAESLPEFLRKRGVVAIEGIDTRALVRHLREAGAMRAVLSTEDLNEVSLVAKARTATPLTEVNFVEEVSRDAVEPYSYTNVHSFASGPCRSTLQRGRLRLRREEFDP